MTGVINGQEFGVATLNTSVHQEARAGVTTIRSSISHMPASVGKWGPSDRVRARRGQSLGFWAQFPGEIQPPPRVGSLLWLGAGHLFPTLHPPTKQKDCI